MGVEDSEPLIFLSHSKLVKHCNNIQLDEVLSLAHLVQGLSDQQEWVTILDCHGIETSIVHTKP